MTEKPKIIITGSMMKDAAMCEQYAYNAHVLHRVPHYDSDALNFGTLFHKGMQYKLEGRDWEALIDEDGYSPIVTAQWHNIAVPVITHFEPPTDWKIVATELELRRDFYPDVILAGRVDAIALHLDRYWSVQWKTYSGSLDALIDRVAISYHEAAYRSLMIKNNYEPYGGVYLGAIKKLTQKQLAECKTDLDVYTRAFTFVPIPATKGQLKTLVGGLIRAREMVSTLGAGQKRNHNACLGAYGNSRCPYFSVCHGNGDINDDRRFRNAPARYT